MFPIPPGALLISFNSLIVGITLACFASQHVTFQEQQFMTNQPTDCSGIQNVMTTFGFPKTDGVYNIYPKQSCIGLAQSCTKSVFCDLTTLGGGWTVIQRRTSSTVNFYQGWQEYKNGFGNPSSNYWIGNDYLAEITANGTYEMLIELTTANPDPIQVRYSTVTVGPEASSYRLTFVLAPGQTDTNLNPSRNRFFGTFDRVTDTITSNISCASYWQSGWWHASQCARTGDLNQPLTSPDPRLAHLQGLQWTVNGQTLQVTASKMMIRPSSFGARRLRFRRDDFYEQKQKKSRYLNALKNFVENDQNSENRPTENQGCVKTAASADREFNDLDFDDINVEDDDSDSDYDVDDDDVINAVSAKAYS